MIRDITWACYSCFMATITILYYLAMFTLIYRSRLWDILSEEKKPVQTAGQFPQSTHPAFSPEQTPTDEQRRYDEVSRLIQELKPLFETAAPKTELMQAIRSKLKDFPSLKGTGFQITINDYLKAQAEMSGSAPLGADEIRGLW